MALDEKRSGNSVKSVRSDDSEIFHDILRKLSSCSSGLTKPTQCRSKFYLGAGIPERKKVFSPPLKKNMPTKIIISRKKNTGKKIFLPKNFKIKSNNDATTNSKLLFLPPNPREGLNPKERSYIYSNFQNHTSRYQFVRKQTNTAIAENKIFTIYGVCNPVRRALIERGWIEKRPGTRMNLSKLRKGKCKDKKEVDMELEKLLMSSLVEKFAPSFIWYTREDINPTSIDLTVNYSAIVNRLKMDAVWTTKQGLAMSMKQNYWNYIEDTADVNCPRTYYSFNPEEIVEFVEDYKLTACTSLLKWVISMVTNDRPIFNENGTIAINVLIFALNRCKEYLFGKQNKDIDLNIEPVSEGQWNTFIKKYYCIIAKTEVFMVDKENKLPLYLLYAKFLLKEMHRYRPQLSCEGCHNIWIIKPPSCSRGRGIRMASKLTAIMDMITKANSKYVVQKYIEEPLLVHDTKFDIRQYYLVTSTYPLVVWMYRDCYLKFSSQRYSLKNFHESIHLTNNAVQRKYANCKSRHPELPSNNMWDLPTYKEYLNRIEKSAVWDRIIYPGMRKSIIGIMLSCQDSLPLTKNCFELYGCDFILDKDYNPWLIEINSNPDLNSTTKVTGKVCPQVLADIIKVVIDRTSNPRADTGRFHCIYRQPITLPWYGGATADLTVRGSTLPPDYFYRGKIQLHEKNKNANTILGLDVKNLIEKLKDCHEDIMKIPEDDFYSHSEEKEEDNESTSSTSDHELSYIASIITQQLDELIDKISISSDGTSSKSLCKPDSQRTICSNKTSFASETVIEIEAGYQSILQKIKKSKFVFPFSKLDDGPGGKASFFGIDPRETFFHDINQTIEVESLSETSLSSITKRIMDFLDSKKTEYSKENHKRNILK